MPTLKLSNGPWDSRTSAKCFVAANSAGEAVRLLRQAGRTTTMYEYRTYWNIGAWGNSMNGIEPERGVWVELEDGKIERLV